MRKESLVIFTISIVLTIGIVGGAHYLYLQQQNKSVGTATYRQPTPIAQSKTTSRNTQPIKGRTAVPIKCKKPDGSVFWTNALRCADADLDNRLSFADPVKRVPRVKVNDSISKKPQSSSAKNNNQKSFPQDMRFQCKYPIGMARKIEIKSLSLKDEPNESVWKDSYCRWVCEARAENCGGLEGYLNLVSICPSHYGLSKRACGTLD